MATLRQFRQANGWPKTAAQYVRNELRWGRRRAANRWYDLRAVLAGYCNNTPYSAIPGEGGGYAHWRCALKAGHVTRHRGLNYTWDDTGRTEYEPIKAAPRQPWDRSMTLTRRQQRQRDRWLNEQFASQRARSKP